MEKVQIEIGNTLDTWLAKACQFKGVQKALADSEDGSKYIS